MLTCAILMTSRCQKGGEPLLVMELCAGGSLKALLSSARTGETPKPTVFNLTTYGYELSKAMTFLEHHSLLHRDLAARNILLTAELTVKLADFGLSRTVGTSDYYRRTAGQSAPIPVRWTAPETLDDNLSTIESDRWSFGVVLWEIFSLAAKPYVGVENFEIAGHVRSGHRLGQPLLCPLDIYSVMQQCWAIAPRDRPAFTVMSAQIYTSLVNSGDHPIL